MVPPKSLREFHKIRAAGGRRGPGILQLQIIRNKISWRP